jgi:hypothetical protein
MCRWLLRGVFSGWFFFALTGVAVNGTKAVCELSDIVCGALLMAPCRDDIRVVNYADTKHQAWR